MRLLLSALMLLSVTLPGYADSPVPNAMNLGWSQLSLETCKVPDFAAEYPTYDGRGVVIAVLDTGVEINAPGLKVTPDGERKVIDVRDFTGDGDLYYTRLESGPDSGTVLFRDAQNRPVVCKVPADRAPIHGEWYGVWLDETRFKDMGVQDINDNGRDDDRLPILIAPFQEGGSAAPVWRLAIDDNGDRDFGDESWMTDYWRTGDHILLERMAPEAQLPMLSLAFNVYAAENRLSVHFDNGGHGTHCAGIAAGNDLLDQMDFDGVAPGAKIISLKIGSNNKAGGSTTPGSKIEAFRYAARYAREHDVPVVCNLSYGIDSVLPGQSDIDNALQQVLIENPELIVCSSAGNSGPTLNTVGTPAAAPDVISVAALLPAETARDARGWAMPHTTVAVFSSRGLDLMKPDIACPGYATSSVTLFNRGGDVYQGTSMASPYAAGLCARLLSGAKQEMPESPVNRRSLRQALALAGKPVEDTSQLDIGTGVPDLLWAYDALLRQMAAQRPEDPVTYRISTPSPMGRGPMPVAVFRGTDLPRDPYTFSIEPVYPPMMDKGLSDQYQERFTVASFTEWLQPVEESIYVRGTQGAQVHVKLDPSSLSAPGLHIGDILLLRETGPAGAGEQVMALRTVVIVPERFDNATRPTATFSGTTKLAWGFDRRFLYVPPYASAVRFRLARDPGLHESVRIRSMGLATGGSVWTGLELAKDDPRDRVEWTWSEGLVGGVLELPVYSPDGEAAVPYTLEAELVAIAADPMVLTQGYGGSPAFDFTLTNQLEEMTKVKGTAVLDATRKTVTATLGSDPRSQGFTRRITLPAGSKGLRIQAHMPREAYLAFTDFAVGIYDTKGKALWSGGLDGPEGGFTWNRAGGGEQTVELRIQPAFTEYWTPREIEMSLDIDTLLAEPVSGTVGIRGDGAGTMPLPPGTPVAITAKFGSHPAGEESELIVGTVTITDASRGDTVRVIPIAHEAR